MGIWRGHKDLKVYQLAYKLAMDVFEQSKTFPGTERYALTDQIRRSSRSVEVEGRMQKAERRKQEVVGMRLP